MLEFYLLVHLILKFEIIYWNLETEKRNNKKTLKKRRQPRHAMCIQPTCFISQNNQNHPTTSPMVFFLILFFLLLFYYSSRM